MGDQGHLNDTVDFPERQDALVACEAERNRRTASTSTRSTSTASRTAIPVSLAEGLGEDSIVDGIGACDTAEQADSRSFGFCSSSGVYRLCRPASAPHRVNRVEFSCAIRLPLVWRTDLSNLEVCALQARPHRWS